MENPCKACGSLRARCDESCVKLKAWNEHKAAKSKAGQVHRACEVCGTVITQSRRKKTCSESCARVADRRKAIGRAKRRPLRVSICQGCGKRVRSRRPRRFCNRCFADFLRSRERFRQKA